jgi:predicted DNA-binding transcriptional regulator AlpA
MSNAAVITEISDAPDRTAPADEQLDGYVTLREFYRLSTLSPPTTWRMRRRGELPEPIRLSPGRVGYPKQFVRDWLAERKQRA